MTSMDATTRARWFHPTPGRFVLALLAVEVLLWLSDRFGWLGWHKGYAVLAAVANVGVAMLLMLGWFAVALIFRWRFQFSIRSLLVLVVVVAVPFSWLAVEMKKAKEQKAAVEAIWRSDGDIVYDWQHYSARDRWGRPTRKPPVPKWVTNWLGDDLFYDIVEVSFPEYWHYSGEQCDDDTLRHLYCLTKLRRVQLIRTNVTDEGVRNLQLALPYCMIEDLGHANP